VLSGTVPVSKRLKERVLDIIHQLDYHPNHVARSLKINRTKLMGMVIGDLGDPLSPPLVRGAEDAAWRENYLLITLNSGDKVERERELLSALRSRRVDGILLVAANDRDAKHIRALKASGIPIVCLDRELQGLGLDCVVVDNVAAARECVAHLIAAGHRRVGILNGTLDVPIARERMAGYREALTSAGLSFDESLTESTGFDAVQGYAAGRKLLDHPRPPTAIFAAAFTLAIGLLQAIRDANLRCPEDVAIAVFDDPQYSEIARPALTAVRQPLYEMGRAGVELLLKRIEEPHRRRTRMVFKTAFQIRESSRTPSAASAD
jgi:DNA-binding LacI/PurR family transcriptional regulator